MTDRLTSALRAHANGEFLKSITIKGILLLVTIAAIAILISLDALKKHGQEAVNSPYTKDKLVAQLDASADAADSDELKVLAAGASGVAPGARFATTDDAFAAIYAASAVEEGLLADERRVRTRYDERISKLDLEIHNLLAVSPRNQEFDDALTRQLDRRQSLMAARDIEIADHKELTKEIRARYEPAFKRVDAAISGLLDQDPSPTKFDERLSAYLSERTALTTARTNELQEVAQRRGSRRDDLKRSFDKTRLAKNGFSFFKGKDRLNAFFSKIVDEKHPLNIFYEMLWYATVILAVVAFAALVLSPLFQALPVQGAQEPLAQRITQLFSTGSRAVARNAAALGAAVVGTVAVVGASSALPSSPLYKAPPAVSRTATSKARAPYLPPRTKGLEDETSPPGLPDDPREAMEALLIQIQTLQTIVNEISVTVNKHDERTTKQYNTLLVSGDRRPPDLSGVTGVLTGLQRTVETAGRSIDGLSGRVNQIDGSVEQLALSTSEGFDFTRGSIDGLRGVVNASNELVKDTKETVIRRTGEVEDSVLIPHHVGERTSLLTATFGFDRYRVSQHSLDLLTKMEAPENVKTAVEGLGDEVQTNDDVRRSMLRALCDPGEHCDDFKNWIASVLRATRAN